MSEAMSSVDVRYDNPLLFSVDKTLILRTDRTVSFCISNWTGYTLHDLAIQIVTIPYGKVLHEHRINEPISDRTIHCSTMPNLNIHDYKGEAFYRLVGRADPGNIPVNVPIRAFIDSGSVAYITDKRVFTFGYYNGFLYMRVDEGSYHLVDDVQFAIYEKEGGISAVRVPSKDRSYAPLNFQPDMTYIIDLAHKFPNKLTLARALFAANPFLAKYVKFDSIQSEEDAEKVIKLVLPFVLENYVRSFYIPMVNVDLEKNTLIEKYMITVRGATIGLIIGLVAVAVLFFGIGFVAGTMVSTKTVAVGLKEFVEEFNELRMGDLDAIKKSFKETIENCRRMSLEIVHAIKPEALEIPKEELIKRINASADNADKDIEVNIESRKKEKIEVPTPVPVGPSIYDIALIGLAGVGAGMLVSHLLLGRDKEK